MQISQTRALLTVTGIILLIATIAFVYTGTTPTKPEIVLPLSVYIPSGITIKTQGTAMRSWLSDQDIKRVIACTNSIYHDQNTSIRFQLRGIHRTPARRDGKLRAKLKYLATVTRQHNSKKENKKRVQTYKTIFTASTLQSNASNHDINIYLLPFTGNTRQGLTHRASRSIWIAEWSNKYSHRPTKRSLDTPRQPSLCKTLGHELGHELGLKHLSSMEKLSPDAKNRLMDGKAGTRLTEKEKRTIYQYAKAIINR